MASQSTPSVTSTSSSSTPAAVVSQSTPVLPDAGAVAGLDGLGLSADEAKRIQSQMANVGQKKQEGKFFLNKENETAVIPQADVVSKATVYFKNCSGCNYTLDGECTKVLIEGCKNSTFTFNTRIITEMLEVWNCENTTIIIDTPIKTIQADTSNELTIQYLRRELMDRLVWAGIHNLHVIVGSGEFAKTFNTGVDAMRIEHPDLNDNTDQFIVRHMKGKIQQEMIVRLANGFPTTNREADAFDEKKARNDKRYEDYIRKMIKAKEIEKGLDMSSGASSTTSSDGKKVPRNGPCPCGSGKKYKKCCALKDSSSG